MYYIGIDLGTSAVKLLLVDENGEIVKSTEREYPLLFPSPSWAEQNPSDWWDACLSGLTELLLETDKSKVIGIGCCGQMHGLVVLDENDMVIRPAILWNDGRTSEEVIWLNTKIGKKEMSSLTANIAFAGFTAPKLLWLKRNEPANFARVKKIMLPKDYINYRLTAVHSTDFTDASGTLLLDVANRRWSTQMLNYCCISEHQLPKLYESYEIVGNLRQEVADKLNLSTSVTVIAGASDNAAAAVGVGITGDGACNISLGTSGTVFISTKQFRVDPNNALHSFCYADGGWHLLGCMLCAASCNKWFCNNILKSSDYSAEQKNIAYDKLGRNRVYFLPYLMGERSPINDTDARGAFIGLSLDTSRADLVQAVMEGVCFAIRDSIEVARNAGVKINKALLCGGGAKSPLWQRILSNTLNIPLELTPNEQGGSYGSALLAMAGETQDFFSAIDTNKLVRTRTIVHPEAALSDLYEERYQEFKGIYPALKQLFKELQ